MASALFNTPQNTARFSVQSMSTPGYLLIALGVIALIGSVVATCCLYYQLGSLSLSIAGAGMIICMLNSILSKYFCLKKTDLFNNQYQLKGNNTQKKHKITFFFYEKKKGGKSIKTDKQHLRNSNNQPSSSHADEKSQVVEPFIQNNEESLQQLPPIIAQHQDDQEESISAKKNEPSLQNLKKLHIKSKKDLEGLKDDELNTLTVEILNKIDNQVVWDVLGQRLKTIENKKSSFKLDFKELENLSFLIVDLKYLTANDINTNPKKFPPITFLLIDINELKKIQIQKLTDQQLQLIFLATDQSDTDYFIQRLTHDQITQCINKIENSSLLKTSLLKNLSEEQVLNLDFAKIDKDIFNLLFSLDESQRFNANVLLPKFKVDKIYDLIPYFSKEHFEYISDEQVKNIDFSKFIQILKNDGDRCNRQGISEMIRILFSTDTKDSQESKAMRRIPKLSVEDIYDLILYFSKEHFKHISDNQIKNILFSTFIKILEDEFDKEEISEIIDILFPTEGTDSVKENVTRLSGLPNNAISFLKKYLSSKANSLLEDRMPPEQT
ncbi:MAG: hypothetical protein R3E91_05375 [Chlamydiales bacterium]